MAKLRLLKTGHGDLVLAEWLPTQADTVDRARTAFQEEISRGAFAFRMFPDEPGRNEPITEFDELSEEVLLVPAIQGG